MGRPVEPGELANQRLTCISPSALAAGALLGESDRWLRLAGAAAMVAGVVMLALG